MKTKITCLKETGFCYGVKRAIAILEESASQDGSVDCLGELVHNPRVMQKLKGLGVNVIDTPSGINSPVVAISAHGVTPEVETELAAQSAKLIDATCPSVKKVQKAVKRLAKNGYSIVVFGDSDHSEVKGIMGYANGRGIAALDAGQVFAEGQWPRKLGIVSQTTQVPENYLKFVKDILDLAMTGNAEITILDTVCQEVRRRQSLSQKLAAKSDLVLVVGGRNSANSRRLAELCFPLTETHLIENASEIDPAWLAGKCRVGVTSGTSTSQETINEVCSRLQALTE